MRRRSEETTEPRGSQPETALAAPPPVTARPAVSPLRARRRPAVVALAVALIALGGGTGAWVLSRSGDTVTVLVVAQDIDRGEVIEAVDLTTTELPVGTANLDLVPYEDLDAVVGQVAAADLHSGSLLGPDSVAEELVTGSGDSVVGVALSAAQLPSVGLSSGDTVRFVATPQQGGEMPVAEPATIEATVINVTNMDAGFLVNVQVASEQAPTLAAMAATSRIALILDPVG